MNIYEAKTLAVGPARAVLAGNHFRNDANFTRIISLKRVSVHAPRNFLRSFRSLISTGRKLAWAVATVKDLKRLRSNDRWRLTATLVVVLSRDFIRGHCYLTIAGRN